MTVEAVVFDLDGVLRHFDGSVAGEIERAHGLSPDSLRPIAFAADLLERAVTGAITRAQWVTEAAARCPAPAAVHALLSQPGRADPAMLAIVARLRAAGVTTALLTNATDTLDEELARDGLDGVVDEVFNTSAMGVAKPDPVAFRRVADALGLAPNAILFTDDRAANTDAADAVGFRSHHFRDAAGFEPIVGDLLDQGGGLG